MSLLFGLFVYTGLFFISLLTLLSHIAGGNQMIKRVKMSLLLYVVFVHVDPFYTSLLAYVGLF